jgi:UDP-2,3-diacylglucosamine hydrolase
LGPFDFEQWSSDPIKPILPSNCPLLGRFLGAFHRGFAILKRMKFVAISDVHIKEKGDDSYHLFLQFLRHPLTQQSDKIFLLGDIFDLLVGGHLEYYKRFESLFDEIVSLIKSGKKVIQLEGNHDFHFVDLIYFIKNKHQLKDEDWLYSTEPVFLNSEGIMLAHGDEIEIENPKYQQYRSLIRSDFINLLANTLVPFRIVDKIGRRASEKSREVNSNRYDGHSDNEKVKERFRRMFKELQVEHQLKNLVCGHSHCADFFETDDGIYVNNGYFPKTRLFTYYENGCLMQKEL